MPNIFSIITVNKWWRLKTLTYWKPLFTQMNQRSKNIWWKNIESKECFSLYYVCLFSISVRLYRPLAFGLCGFNCLFVHTIESTLFDVRFLNFIMGVSLHAMDLKVPARVTTKTHHTGIISPRNAYKTMTVHISSIPRYPSPYMIFTSNDPV